MLLAIKRNSSTSMEKVKATAVLITKDKEYPQEILNFLPDFDEVIIKTECPSIHQRYELAKQAKNDLIYVQDDDCLPNILHLLQRYNGQITNFMKQGHFDWYGKTGITLIGWGAFFPKQMINFDKYLAKFDVDEIFLSQTDRIFTYLNQPFNTLIADVIDLPRATDHTRMSSNPNHWEKLNTIRQRLALL